MQNQYWRELFDLVAENNDNEIVAIEFIQTIPDNLKKTIVNTVSVQVSGDETMLMWAAWRVKPTLFKALLKAGADPHYQNAMGESVVTYLNANENNQEKIIEIIKLLVKQHVDLHKNSYLSYSIVKRSNVYCLDKVRLFLAKLGYIDFDF